MTNPHHTIRILGIPLDHGASRRGVDLGPNAIRKAMLHTTLQGLGYSVNDMGNINISNADITTSSTPSTTITRPDEPRSLNLISTTCMHLFEEARDMIGPGIFPLFLGGDHSIAMGSAAAMGAQGNTGLIWVDAHADFNTHETSSSQNIHGMPLSALCGWGHPLLLAIGEQRFNPSNVVLIGIHSVDPNEKQLLRQSGITVYSMKDIDLLGMPTVMEKTIAQLQHLDRVHLSFDIDAVEPAIAPGVGTPEPGGLTLREAHLLCELLFDHHLVTSADFVEVNPTLDIQNATAKLTVDLIASLLGKSTI